jgi:AcrR family transcriptional regulator
MPKIPASERDAFYEARRVELADVALKLWAERGFDQTSVEAIAVEAGVSKGTFYLYFESKDALLEEVLRRNSLVPNIQQLIADLQTRSFEEAVHGFVRGAWRHLVGHRELVLVALRELPTHLEQAQRLLERVMVPVNRLLAGYLERHIDADRAQELSLPIAARGLPGMVLFVFLTQEVLGAGRFLPESEDKITFTIAELFLRGVGTARPEEVS